jgi:hypothetical protein
VAPSGRSWLYLVRWRKHGGGIWRGDSAAVKGFFFVFSTVANSLQFSHIFFLESDPLFNIKIKKQ